MTLGDGIRRSIATIGRNERDLFIDAVKQLNRVYYSPNGSRTDFPAGRVSKWFKQDEIHQGSHVHGCPAFLPWHREICNRFEALLRSIHPELSLHYWDWNLDPSNMPDETGQSFSLFDSDFMGNADGTINEGSVGEPLLSAGFYLLNPSDPDPVDGKFRDDISPVTLNRPNPSDPATFSYPTTSNSNPADPPKTLTRQKRAGAPPVGQTLKDPFAIHTPDGNPDWTPVPSGTPFPAVHWATDAELVNAPTWESFNDLMQGGELAGSNDEAHGLAHSYIGGNLADAHISFRDPFVFLLHSNIDRIWAMWQKKNPTVRLDPAQVYGTQGNSKGKGDVEDESETNGANWGILSPLEPWAGFEAQTNTTGRVAHIWPMRTWFAPENEQNQPGNNKNSKDASVVTPPRYDTAP
jgi:tyrosinase-like protein